MPRNTWRKPQILRKEFTKSFWRKSFEAGSGSGNLFPAGISDIGFPQNDWIHHIRVIKSRAFITDSYQYLDVYISFVLLCKVYIDLRWEDFLGKKIPLQV